MTCGTGGRINDASEIKTVENSNGSENDTGRGCGGQSGGECEAQG